MNDTQDACETGPADLGTDDQGLTIFWGGAGAVKDRGPIKRL